MVVNLQSLTLVGHNEHFFVILKLGSVNYTLKLRIQSEYRKIRTRNNSVFGHFSRSVSKEKCVNAVTDRGAFRTQSTIHDGALAKNSSDF